MVSVFRLNMTDLHISGSFTSQVIPFWGTEKAARAWKSMKIAKRILSCAPPPLGLRKTVYVCASDPSFLFNLSGLWFLDTFPHRFFASMRCALCCFPVFLFLSPISSHVCFQATRGSHTAFHKDNIALLNRWSVHVLSVISIGLDTPRDRGDFSEHLEFFNKHIFKELLLLFGAFVHCMFEKFCFFFLHRCEIATQKRDFLYLKNIIGN